MAKRILLGVLQDYFGRYIDGINDENLKVAVWRGEIDLEGLELKKEVLDALRLPLTIHCGHIKKFKVSVPWTKLGSQPVQVHIDGVYLLARLAPEDEDALDEDDEDDEEEQDAGEEHATSATAAEVDSEGPDDDDSESASSEDDERRSVGHGARQESGSGTPTSAAVPGSSRAKKGTRRRKGPKKLPRRIVEKRIRLRWANLLAAGEQTKGGGDGKASDKAADNSFLGWLGAKIVDNLQVTITNVHVRLEDMMSIPNHPFAIGCTFEKFSAETCDENGKPHFVERNARSGGGPEQSTFFKSVQFQSLAAYWDVDKPMVFNTDRSELDFAYQLARGIWRKELRASYANGSVDEPILEFRDLHHFLLRPCSPSMLVAKNESSDFSKPRYKMDVNFDDIAVVVSRRQYSMVLALQRSLAQNSILSVYREQRPLDSPLEDPAAWWRYAYKCIKIRSAALRLNKQSRAGDDQARLHDKLLRLTQANQRVDWMDLVRQVQQRDRYIHMYKQFLYAQDALHAKNGKKAPDLDNDDAESHALLRADLQEIEDDLEVENTLAYRAAALAELQAEQEKSAADAAQQAPSQSKGWLSGWFAEQNADGGAALAYRNPVQLTAEEKAELFDAVNFFETIQDHHIPTGTVHVLVRSSLRYVSVALADEAYERVLFSAEVSGRHTLETRFGNSWKHSFVLKTLTLWDHAAASAGSEAQAQVLAPKLEEGEERTKGNACVLNAEYKPATYDTETNAPLTKEAYTVRVAAVPFRVVLLPTWTNAFSRFFYERSDYLTALEWVDPLRGIAVEQTVGPERARRRSSAANPPHIRPRQATQGEDSTAGQSFDQGFNAEVNWVAEYIERSSETTRRLEEASLQSVLGARLRPDFDVEMNIAAPILLLPVYGLRLAAERGSKRSNEETQSLFMLDLGHIHVQRQDGVESSAASGSEARNLERQLHSQDSLDSEVEVERRNTTEEAILDAVENSLDNGDGDLRAEAKDVREPGGPASRSRLQSAGSATSMEAGAEQGEENSTKSADKALGAWNISVARVRSRILVLPANTDWTAALTEAGAGSDLNAMAEDTVFNLVDEFDIHVSLFHLFSQKRSPRIEARLSTVSAYITPTGVLASWKLRNQWAKESWWWLAEGATAAPAFADAAPQRRRVSSFGIEVLPQLLTKTATQESPACDSQSPPLPPAPEQEQQQQQQQSASFGTIYGFSSSEIVLNVSADARVGRPAQRYLQCTFRGLEAQYVQRSKGSSAHVELRSVDAIDIFARQAGAGEGESYFILSEADETSAEQSLISIDMLWRHADAPEAGPKLIYTVAKFHKMRVEWNPETVREIKKRLPTELFKQDAHEVSRKQGDPIPSRGSVPSTSSPGGGAELPEDLNDGAYPQARSSAEAVRFQILVYMTSFTVALRKCDTILAEASMTRASVNVSRGAFMRARGELGNVRVTGGGHELFSVTARDKALVKVSYTAQPREHETSLLVEINSSRYVHLHLVFLEVTDYISTWILTMVAELIRESVRDGNHQGDGSPELTGILTTVAELIRKSVRDGNHQGDGSPEGSKLTTFAVKMETFEAVFPVTLAVDENRFLAASCSSLRASKLRPGPTEVRMAGFRVMTSDVALLDAPVDFALDVSMSGEGLIHVDGRISDVAIDLPLNQYWLIQDMFSYNIMEDPPPAPPRLSASDATSFSSFEGRNEAESEDGGLANDDNGELELSQLKYDFDRVLGDDDEGAIFRVDIRLERASLHLSQHPQATPSPRGPAFPRPPAVSLAKFSMEAFHALIFRESPEGSTAIELRVASLDLTDERPESASNLFRHLIMSNPRVEGQTQADRESQDPPNERLPGGIGDAVSSAVNRELACFFRYVHSERQVRLDLVDFRSVFMANLLAEVVGFWTSSDDAEPDEAAAISPQWDILEDIKGWQGEFNLINPYICFVPDYADPMTRMVVVRSDITFTWSSEGDPNERQFSYWVGRLCNAEAFVAAAGGVNIQESAEPIEDVDGPAATLDKSRRLGLGQEGIMQQLLEPTDLNWSYEYEEVALKSKVHARRVDLKCGQLELYVSMNDAALVGAILANIGSKSSNEPELTEVRKRTQAKSRARWTEAVQRLRSQDSGHTLCSEDDNSPKDDDDADEKDWAERCQNDADYLEIVIPKGTPEAGLLLEQDHGFVRVVGMYSSYGDGGGSVCEVLGVQTGDYLLELNGEFVCNESPEIVLERLAMRTPPYVLRFLRGTSEKPVILQDSLTLGTQKVIFNLIDDLEDGDMPLSNLVLSKIDFFLNGSNDGNYICGSQMEMTGAHFYDLRAGSWGVLMDPGRVNLSCTYYNSGELEVTVDIPEPISCNLPDTFLRVISNSLARAGEAARAEGKRLGSRVSAKAFRRKLGDMYVKTKQAAIANSDEQNNAFLFRNETGLALRFWKQGEDPAESAVFMGPEDSEVPLGFPYHAGVGQGTIRGFCQYKPLSISFLCPRTAVEGGMSASAKPDAEVSAADELEQVWETLEGVVVNKIGDGVARLVARKSRRGFSPNGLRIRWTVEIDDDTRKLKLIVSSLLLVQNHLDYSMRVLANCPTWSSPQSLPWVLGPGESRRVPVLYGDAIEVRVQPMLPEHLEENASHTYEWSGPVHAALASQGNTAYTELECSLFNGKTRYLCASVEPDEDGVTTVFALHPQVRFRNLLPQDVHFMEHIPEISSDMPIGAGCVNSGEEIQLHSMTSSSIGGGGTLSMLEMKLEASDWTSKIPLRARRTRRRGASMYRRHGSKRFRKISFLKTRVGAPVSLQASTPAASMPAMTARGSIPPRPRRSESHALRAVGATGAAAKASQRMIGKARSLASRRLSGPDPETANPSLTPSEANDAEAPVTHARSSTSSISTSSGRTLTEDVADEFEDSEYDDAVEDEEATGVGSDEDEFALVEDEEDDDDAEVFGAASAAPRALQPSSSSGGGGGGGGGETAAQDANTLNSRTIGFSAVRGGRGGEENSCRVKFVCEEAEAGGLLVVLYADCWIVNHTGLELRYSSEAGISWVSPTQLNIAKGNEAIVLFEPPGGRMRIAHESSSSAQTVDVTTPGMQGHVVIVNRGGSSRLSLDLGVAVDVGPGLLHRTNMITIVPRFTFANFTGCDLIVRAYSSRGASGIDEMLVPPGSSMPFWMPSNIPRDVNPRFQIRFGAQRLSPVSDSGASHANTTEWSQGFDVERMLHLRTAMSCKLKRGKVFESYQLEVQVGDTAGSIVVELSKQGFEQLRADSSDSLDLEAVLGGAEGEGSLSDSGERTRRRPSDVTERGGGASGLLKRFSKVRFDLNIAAVDINLQRDQTDLTVYYRGLEKARREREDRHFRRTGVPSARHAGRRPELVAALSLRGFKALYGTDKVVDRVLVKCRSLDVMDKTRNPVFPHVLSGSGASVSEPMPARGPMDETPFFKMLVHHTRTKKLGYTELNLVEAQTAAVDLCLAETFLLELLDFKTSVFHGDKRSSPGIMAAESGVESVSAVLQWADLSSVARAARKWARRRGQEKGLASLLAPTTSTEDEPAVSLQAARAQAAANQRSGASSLRQNAGNKSAGDGLGLNSVKVHRLDISRVEIRLSYQQHPDKLQSATLYDLGGGLLSRMNIRVDKARMNLEAFEKINFIGSTTTLWMALQKHYQTEARNSMMGIFSAVSLRSTDFGITAAIRDRLSLTSAKVQSDEFAMREFKSSDALIDHFKADLRPGRASCSNIESFVRVLRNLVYDWRNNHRFLYGRKVCVIGVINRSSKGLRVEKPKSGRLAKGHIMVPHTEIPARTPASMLEPWQPGREWNDRGYTAWLVSSKLKEAVVVETSCAAFKLKATVPGELAITSSQDFSVAFVHRDVQNTNALYVIAIEDKLPTFRG